MEIVTGLLLLPIQCRMARTALGLGVREVAELAVVSPNTIARLERGEEMRPATIAAVRAALESAGIIFVEENGEGPGVRLRKRFPQPPYTLEDFFATVDSFERDRLAEVRKDLEPARLAAGLRIKRRDDGIDLFVGESGPIGRLTFGAKGLKFVPDLIEGRDWTPSQWLTPNELARWTRQAWETNVAS